MPIIKDDDIPILHQVKIHLANLRTDTAAENQSAAEYDIGVIMEYFKCEKDATGESVSHLSRKARMELFGPNEQHANDANRLRDGLVHSHYNTTPESVFGFAARLGGVLETKIDDLLEDRHTAPLNLSSDPLYQQVHHISKDHTIDQKLTALLVSTTEISNIKANYMEDGMMKLQVSGTDHRAIQRNIIVSGEILQRLGEEKTNELQAKAPEQNLTILSQTSKSLRHSVEDLPQESIRNCAMIANVHANALYLMLYESTMDSASVNQVKDNLRSTKHEFRTVQKAQQQQLDVAEAEFQKENRKRKLLPDSEASLDTPMIGAWMPADIESNVSNSSPSSKPITKISSDTAEESKGDLDEINQAITAAVTAINHSNTETPQKEIDRKPISFALKQSGGRGGGRGGSGGRGAGGGRGVGGRGGIFDEK